MANKGTQKCYNFLFFIVVLLLFACGVGYCGDPGVENNLFRFRMLFLQRKPFR
jgi:hypothetical protein